MSSRNFCGIFCRRAMSAMRTGSPGRCDARSKIACKAYSPFTEMFIGVDRRNHLCPSRDCRLQCRSKQVRPNILEIEEAFPLGQQLEVQLTFVGRGSAADGDG